MQICPRIREAFREIAALMGPFFHHSLDHAIEERRRRLYLERVNADYAALNRDPKSAADHRTDVDAWSATDSDGWDDFR